MSKFTKILVLGVVLGLLPATAPAASSPGTVAGTWRKLAPETVALPYGANVWTGRRLILFGRRPLTKTTFNPSVNAALAYDPAANAWTTLSPPAQRGGSLGCCKAVWTGREMLVFGANLEYNPGTNTWSALRKSIPQGIVAWTGREAIGWGGGCCGDVRSDGAAYNPTTDTYRKLPGSPLAPSQEPIGAWDGRDLLLFGSGYDIAGKPTPARFARAAAYNPATNRWRRIAAPPLHGRFAGTAVSAGGEVLVIGAGANAQSTLAYNPSANRWRRLAPLPSSRTGASVVWTGSRLLVFGGQSLNGSGDLRAGLSYDPGTNRWSVLPQPPLRAPGASIAWTGRSLLVFGGVIGSSAATHNKQIWLHGVAGFTPATP